MTDTSPEPATQPVVATEPAPVATQPAENRPSRLLQVLAWVGIVAGIVFITAVVFGTGFFLGAHSGGDGHHHRGGHDRGGMMMFHRGGPPMGPGHGMMPPGGPGAFGPGGPGWGPGGSDGPGSRPERPETPATPVPPARP